MPGNEVGDRIHNFFAQENLSQGQHHSEVVDGSWTGLGNNPWVGSQRQIGTPFISNLKNLSIQQSADSERGYRGHSSTVQHGMNFSHQFARSQSQNQQPTANGYIHGNQAFQTRQNETNLLGVDTEPDRRNLTSRGFAILDAQLESGPELHKKNSARMDFNDAPINYDFLGGQQHASNQHPGMLQCLPRQQSGISDMQLLQQQVIFKQMQEMQRQQQHQKQQLQQQETRQLNSANHPSFAKQAAGSHPPAMVNGVPIHDASNYSWQPELMATNSNWLQRVVSPTMQGSSSGLMFSPEQGQAPRLMGMIPQQVDQSLYGVPISGTRVASNQYSTVQMDKPTMQQMSDSSNSFSGNQYAGFPDHASMHDGTLVARQGYQGKNMMGSADSQGSNGVFNLDNLQRVDARQSNGPGQDFHGRQDVSGPSETLQEKTVMQVAHSQNVATLDPTEEKILFGSDDNLWEAFGRSTNTGSGGYNMLDGAEFFGSFPSMHSGSWSALMQSAVAETSSADVGMQEEWSGLTFRNSEPPTGIRPSPNVNDIAKQQSTWDDNRLQASSVPNARPYGISDGTNSNVDYNNMPGLKQSGASPSNEPNERLHTVSSQRFVEPSSGEGTKWLDWKPIQEPVSGGSHNYEKSVRSSDAESNAKSISGFWTNQQNISSYTTTGGQPTGRPNGWKFVDSASPRLGTVLKNHGNENSLQASQSTEFKSPMFEAMGYGAGMWKNDSVSKSLGLERAKSAVGSPQVNREDSSLNNVAALPESSSGRANQGSCQQIPNGSNIDIWKHNDPSVNPKGCELPGKYQPHMGKSHQTFESSGNNSLGNGAVETHDYPDTKESKTDSFRNVCHYNSSTDVRENAWLDASDSLTLSGAKVKPSSTGRKSQGIRKFQYHPMGDVDVDVEPSYGTKRVTHAQAMLTQVSQAVKGQDHGGIGKSKFTAQIARNSMEIDKGHFPGYQGEAKGLDEITSNNILSGSAPSTSTSLDRDVHNYATGKTTPSSQNMLELLHKVDQSRERGKVTNFSSSDCNQPSYMHENKNSDGSVHVQQKQSSASQGFGLQLGPPSQLLPIQDHALSSQSPSQANNSLSSTHVTSEVGEKGHTWLASTSSVQGLPPSHETSPGELRNKISSTFGQTGKNSQGENSSTVFSPGFPYTRSHLQNQPMHDAGGQATTSQSGNVFFDRLASQSKQINESFERAQSSQSTLASVPDMSGSTLQNGVPSSVEMRHLSNSNQTNGKDSAPHFPVLESVPARQDSIVSGTSQENFSAKMSSSMWTSVSTQQHSFGSQAFKASYNMFKSNIQLNNDSEIASSRLQKLEADNVQMIGNVPSEPGATSVISHGFAGKEQPVNAEPSQQVPPENDPGQKTINVSQGAESVANCVAGTSIPNPTSTQREIEAFGRSLRPNNFLHQNYSLIHQVQGIRNAEVDPGNRSLKRFKGPDSSVDAHQVGLQGGKQFYGHSDMVKDAPTIRASVLPDDSKMLNFSGKPTDIIQDKIMSSQDAVAFGQNDSQNFSNSSAVSVITEHSQISPQMAPSWFDQYGTFKNGQILPLPDAQKIATIKAMELPFTVGRLSSQGTAEQGNAVASQHGLKGSTPSSLASENLSSLQLTNPDATDVSLAIVRPKKRKSATSEFVPWHKQVVLSHQMLQNISSAESAWALAVNRLTEKVEDEAEMVDDGPSAYRSKRRIVLTTQLMQLLFFPPMASVLSADALSHYESVVHFLARSTLGDVCSTLSCAGSDTPVLSSSGNILRETLTKSEKISDQYFSKVVEDLINRARKLENAILRLDKRASVLDLRLECQELEKFSVINRFAKFHSRASADVPETSSSSDATTNAQKSFLQRYVIALPMPRNLPDRVQCFSL